VEVDEGGGGRGGGGGGRGGEGGEEPGRNGWKLNEMNSCTQIKRGE